MQFIDTVQLMASKHKYFEQLSGLVKHTPAHAVGGYLTLSPRVLLWQRPTSASLFDDIIKTLAEFRNSH